MADTATKPGILRNLKIKRVALVDMGANFDRRTGDGAHITLWKRAIAKDPSVAAVHSDAPMGGSPTPAPKKPKRITPDHPDYPQYETDYEKTNLDAESRHALPDSAFAAVWTDSKGNKNRKLPIHDAGHLAAARGRLNAAKIPSDVKATARRRIDAATRRTQKENSFMKDILKRMLGLLKEEDPTKRAAGMTEVETMIEKANPFADDGDADDKVHKANDPMCKCADCVAKRAPMPADITKRFELLEKANTDLIAKLATANLEATTATNLAKSVMEKADKAEMRAILKSFVAVPFKTDDDVEVDAFLLMKRTTPAAYTAMIEKYRGIDAQLAKSELFAHDLGSSRNGGGEGSAWAQIEAKADALIAKGGITLTREQMIEKVLLDPANNELVAQYRAEAQ